MIYLHSMVHHILDHIDTYLQMYWHRACRSDIGDPHQEGLLGCSAEGMKPWFSDWDLLDNTKYDFSFESVNYMRQHKNPNYSTETVGNKDNHLLNLNMLVCNWNRQKALQIQKYALRSDMSTRVAYCSIISKSYQLILLVLRHAPGCFPLVLFAK